MMYAHIYLAAVILYSAFLVLGCKPRERPVDIGVRDQIIHIASGAEPQSLDPHLVTGIVEFRIVQNLFEGLVAIDPVNMEPIPAAAKSWEVLDDGKRYRFHLRQNLRWSNGDAMTSKDFMYGYRRVLSPALGNQYIEYFFQNITNALAYNKEEISNFDEVGFRAPDDYTIEVILDKPSPVFLFYFSQPSFLPVHQGNIEAHGRIDQRGTGWFRPGNMIGNGAFKLTEWETNTVVSLVPNEYYWDRETVRLNQAHFYPIENQDAQFRAFLNGQVHVALQIPLHVITEMEVARPPEYRSHLLHGIYYYEFNVGKPPLNDVRVRKALNLAINREDIVRRVTRGGQRPAYSYIPLDANKYQPDFTLTENVEEARQFLAEAGYPGGEGFPVLELLYNTAENHRKIAEAIQQMWNTNLGIKIKLVNMEWKVYLDARDNGDFQIARAGWGSDPDYLGYLNLFGSDSGLNRTRWTNTRFDKLYEDASVMMDPQERMSTVHEAEAILLDELPMLPICFYTRNYFVDTRVKNWHNSPLDTRLLKYMYLEE